MNIEDFEKEFIHADKIGDWYVCKSILHFGKLKLEMRVSILPEEIKKCTAKQIQDYFEEKSKQIIFLWINGYENSKLQSERANITEVRG